MSFLLSRRIMHRMQPVPRLLNHRTMATQPPPPQQQPVSRTKQFMKKYGYVGIGVYLALGTVDLATTMAVISGWIGMEHTPLEKNQAHEKPSLTSIFVIAYGIHKTVLLPFRLSLTAAITPAVARRLKNWGWLKNKLVKK
ncbi:hypothetical protein MBANPS3_008069 [Mucor bainieri]